LLPAGVSLLSTRSTSTGEPEQRLRDYFEQLHESLASFDTMSLDAVCFACTASSYLVDSGEERRRICELEDRFGYPVIVAATAIEQALSHLNAHCVALACPYPQWLFERAVSWWKSRGLDVCSAVSMQPQMGDTRGIYELSGMEKGKELVRLFEDMKADAIVISGTGMPGLQAIVDLHHATGLPVVISNLCLAWAALRSAGIELRERSPSSGFPLLDGWQHGIGRL